MMNRRGCACGWKWSPSNSRYENRILREGLRNTSKVDAYTNLWDVNPCNLVEKFTDFSHKRTTSIFRIEE
jgi:hypothetical protein